MERINPEVFARRQLSLDFTPGLTERYDSALDCVRGSVHQQARPLKSIAMDMDMSQSDLSRKLAGNPDDPRRFTLDDLERYIKATGDTQPILWLAQRYCADPALKEREALGALAGMVPQLQALLKAAGVHA